jgi:hypothetical protein
MRVALWGANQYYANDGGRRALATAVAGWGLVVLTHPVHAAAAGAGVAAAWLVWDRTPAGLAAGAGIAVGGIAIASPWWLTVVAHHGPDIFFAGAGSHGSLNHSLSDLGALVDWFWGAGYVLDWPAVLSVLGATVLVARGNWHQPAWLAVPVVLLVPPHGRLGILFIAPLGAIGAILAFSLVRETEFDRLDLSTRHIDVPNMVPNGLDVPDLETQQVVAMVFLVVLIGPFVGQNMAAVSGSGPHSALPAYVDSADRTAMEWIEDETPADAQVAVIGGVSEWFPYLTDRTSVIVKYGTEWSGQATFNRHDAAQSQIADCLTASCVNNVLGEYEFASEVDYVYVPYGSFVSGRSGAAISPVLHQSLAASDQFSLVYRNSGVGVYGYNETEIAQPDRQLSATGN